MCLNLLTVLSDKGHIRKVPLLQQRAKSCGNIMHFNSLCGVGGGSCIGAIFLCVQTFKVILRFILPCKSDCHPISGIAQFVTRFTHA